MLYQSIVFTVYICSVFFYPKLYLICSDSILALSTWTCQVVHSNFMHDIESRAAIWAIIPEYLRRLLAKMIQRCFGFQQNTSVKTQSIFWSRCSLVALYGKVAILTGIRVFLIWHHQTFTSGTTWGQRFKTISNTNREKQQRDCRYTDRNIGLCRVKCRKVSTHDVPNLLNPN